MSGGHERTAHWEDRCWHQHQASSLSLGGYLLTMTILLLLHREAWLRSFPSLFDEAGHNNQEGIPSQSPRNF